MVCLQTVVTLRSLGAVVVIAIFFKIDGFFQWKCCVMLFRYCEQIYKVCFFSLGYVNHVLKSR